MSQDTINPESITTVIRTHVKPGKEEEYEEWLIGIAKDCSEFGGFQGVTIFRPNDPGHRHPEYVVTLRFAGYDDLRRWELSPEFAEWQRRAQLLWIEPPTRDSRTGMETWFVLPGHAAVVPSPRYKMAIVAFAGAAPIVLVVLPLMASFLDGVLPLIGISFINLLLMASTMTWVTMPTLTKFTRRWLYPTT